MKKTIYILVFALVCGAMAQYTMLDIRYILGEHQEQMIRNSRTRTRRREYDFLSK